MFRLARMIVLCLLAFVAGVFFERSGQAESCDTQGGRMQSGLCVLEAVNGG